ncbi:MAG: 2'-5' RNA ligase family protein [Eggerthellaceae bacterium]|jgi:hypothetical protein
MAATQVHIHALLPEELSERIVSACRKENARIGMDEALLHAPLAITLKQGYETPDITVCLDQLKAYFTGHGGFAAMIARITVINGMLWLELSKEPSLARVHLNLDRLLQSQFDVPEKAFDEDFRPHVTLFQGQGEDNLNAMAQALEGRFEQEVFGIDLIRIEISGQPDLLLPLA